MTNIVDLSLVRQGRDKLALAKMLGAKSIDEENMTHNCEYVLCGAPFETKRKDARFCSDLHRALSNQLRNRREPSALATLLFRASQAENQFDGGSSNADVKRARDAILLDVLRAIEVELGVEPADELDEPDELQNEPENDAEQDPLDADILREKLRVFRAETGFSQGKIANLISSNQPTISQFQNGKMVPAKHVRRAILDLVTQDHGLDRR